MKEYIVTVWDRNWIYKKYSYKVGLTDLDSYKLQLKDKYNRFTVEEADA